MSVILTNLGKTKEEVIFELVLSLNQGGHSYTTLQGEAMPRIDWAISQYEKLVESGIIKETEVEAPRDK